MSTLVKSLNRPSSVEDARARSAEAVIAVEGRIKEVHLAAGGRAVLGKAKGKEVAERIHGHHP